MLSFSCHHCHVTIVMLSVELLCSTIVEHLIPTFVSFSFSVTQNSPCKKCLSHILEFSSVRHTTQFSPNVRHTTQYSPNVRHTTQFFPNVRHTTQFSPNVHHTTVFSKCPSDKPVFTKCLSHHPVFYECPSH